MSHKPKKGSCDDNGIVCIIGYGVKHHHLAALLLLAALLCLAGGWFLFSVGSCDLFFSRHGRFQRPAYAESRVYAESKEQFQPEGLPAKSRCDRKNCFTWRPFSCFSSRERDPLEGWHEDVPE